MSLDWRLTKIKDYETLCWLPDPVAPAGRKRLNPVTNVIIWATMPVGMNQITEKNYDKFFVRLSALESAFGSYLKEVNRDELVDRPITLAEVRQHIGLATNAASLTGAQFRRQLGERAMREAQERLKNSTA
jgi:hypothetical protein